MRLRMTRVLIMRPDVQSPRNIEIRICLVCFCVNVIMETSRAESCSFYVAKLPPSVFETDPEASIRVRHHSHASDVLYQTCIPNFQPEFENIFRSYGDEVAFVYLKSFGRVRVIYPDPEQCSIAWRNLVGHEFQGGTLQLRPVTVSHTTHSPTHTHTHSDTQTQTQTQTQTNTHTGFHDRTPAAAASGKDEDVSNLSPCLSPCWLGAEP